VDQDFESGLTQKQREFYLRLFDFKRHYGLPPTIREMQELGHFRSPRTVVQYLEALEAAGYIQRLRGARNMRLLRRPLAGRSADHAETVEVPIVGRVAAGVPILAEENVVGAVRVSKQLACGASAYFILEVDGDSMNRAGINNGDLVLVRQQQTANPGENVVALIDESATVKRLRITPEAIVLEPVSSNPANLPIILQRDFRIQGVVVTALPRNEDQ
jgi:SOS regulatory protein LexA